MGAPLRVLVTGAFGNIGSSTVPLLLERGYRVRALVHVNRPPELCERFAGAEFLQGDVRERGLMQRALSDVDIVLHLAYVIPPRAWQEPELAASTNIGGTEALLAAARASATPPRVLFASTLDVYGHTTHPTPPRRVTDPVEATDNYSAHKIECEQRVRDSGLTFSIFRLADVPPIALRQPVPAMFEIPLETRIETLHPRDAGLALANALEVSQIWGRTFNIGGGPLCQLTYREYLGQFLRAMGVGTLPDEAFSKQPYCTDWLDTEESQKLLGYQHSSFADIVRETAALLGWKAPLARFAGPLVRRQILSLSPHWRGR